MFKRIKNIFKKSEWNNSSWISLLWWFHWNTSLSDNECVKFFQSWQYAAITAIADSVSSLNYRLADKNDKDIDHEYMKYITPELLQNIAIFMKLCWTAYVWKVVLGWKVLGLSILLPWNLYPVIDEYSNLKWWNYSWENWALWWMKLSVDEVLVFAEFNPFERYPYITRGYSPLQALAMTLWWEKEIEKWNYSLLSNDVPPWMILTTDQALSPEQVMWIKQAWERNHSWASNVWKLAILPFWIKPSNFQASPKEMEFIAQQERDRDKILAIYKVPKAVLWIWEWVNVWNVKAFNQIFSSRCIAPLCKKISRVLNDWLFNWVWVFEFLNVLPTDEDQVREHYLSWCITKNEYRIELWYKPVKGWDVFIDWSECIVDKVWNDWEKNTLAWFDFKGIVKRHVPWSDEWMRERLKERDLRLLWYEKELRSCLIKIFSKQESDILNLFKKDKTFIKRKSVFSFLWKKYYSLYYVLLKEVFKKIVRTEWEHALWDVSNSWTFNVDDPVVIEWIKELIKILAESVDSTTDKKLDDSFMLLFERWDVSLGDLHDVVSTVYDELKNIRMESIVKTESVRLSNFADEQAWSLSWKVKRKQWWTTEDEKRCWMCSQLHWKEVKIRDDFVKGVQYPPLHPNCRCMMKIW